MDSYIHEGDAMSSFSISVPSKTFLSGEYLALLDGPAILIGSQPRFVHKFDLNEDKEFYTNPIENEKDPLFQYWDENEDFLMDFDSEFMDPYDGEGGFGASSAQWATYYAFVNQYHNSIKNLFDKSKNENDFLKNLDFQFIEEFLNKYRSYSKSKFPPSGYDVISQWTGKLTYIDIKNKVIKRLDWPFNNLSFVLIKSSEKTLTHTHLEDLKQIPEKELRACVAKVLKAIEEHDERLFVEGVRENYVTLSQAGLVTPQAQRDIEKLLSHEYVLAAKGCGALGADVFCAIVKTDHLAQFMNYASNEGLNMVATESQLSHGIEVKADFSSTTATLH